MKKTKAWSPVQMLDVLTEIKTLCEKNMFVPKLYAEKQPSVWHIIRPLTVKGIIVKKYGGYFWTGGIPNAEMAKYVLLEKRQYTEKVRMNMKKRNDDKKIQYELDQITTAQKHIEENQEPKTSLTAFLSLELLLKEANNKIYQLEKENEKLKNTNAFPDLKRIIDEGTDKIYKLENEIEKLTNSNYLLNEIVERISSENKQLRRAEEDKTTVKPNPSVKRVKFLGITVFQIE